MIDISIFEGVVVFEAEGYTYQAIWHPEGWNMAAMVQRRISERHDIVAPRDATPKILLTAWWAHQRKVGTYRNPDGYSASNAPTKATASKHGSSR